MVDVKVVYTQTALTIDQLITLLIANVMRIIMTPVLLLAQLVHQRRAQHAMPQVVLLATQIKTDKVVLLVVCVFVKMDILIPILNLSGAKNAKLAFIVRLVARMLHAILAMILSIEFCLQTLVYVKLKLIIQDILMGLV